MFWSWANAWRTNSRGSGVCWAQTGSAAQIPAKIASVSRIIKLGRVSPPQRFTKSREGRIIEARTEAIVQAITEVIGSIPRGKVASYGRVAAAAGYPRHIRMVPRVLNLHGDGLPWHRVLGAGGAIRLPADEAREQRLRLKAEGVGFRGMNVDLAAHEYQF